MRMLDGLTIPVCIRVFLVSPLTHIPFIFQFCVAGILNVDADTRTTQFSLMFMAEDTILKPTTHHPQHPCTACPSEFFLSYRFYCSFTCKLGDAEHQVRSRNAYCDIDSQYGH
jgi:hypothetical protein